MYLFILLTESHSFSECGPENIAQEHHSEFYDHHLVYLFIFSPDVCQDYLCLKDKYIQKKGTEYYGLKFSLKAQLLRFSGRHLKLMQIP